MESTYQARTGHQRTKFSHTNSNGDAKRRQAGALNRLEIQLKIGAKHINRLSEHSLNSVIVRSPLTEKDIKRIEKEIEILKERI